MASEIESNGTIATANLLEFRVVTNGTIELQNITATERNDFDYFKIYVSSPGVIKFKINGQAYNYNVALYGSDGQVVGNTSGGYLTGFDTYSLYAPSTGYYYISISGIFQRGSSNNYSIEPTFDSAGTLTVQYEIENNDTLNSANDLAANLPTRGRSSNGEIDYFKLSTSGIGTTQFTVSLPENNYITTYFIDIYDAAGNKLLSKETLSSQTYSVPTNSVGYSYISIYSSYAGLYSIAGSFSGANSSNNPTYIISSNSSSTNEGSAATFTLSTTNVASGTSVPYTLSGISAADVSGGSLAGNTVVNSSGIASISVSLINDLLTEGSETLTVTAGGASASTQINDTSVGIKPTYILFADAPSFDEGSTASFNLTTTNLPAGSILTYTLEKVSMKISWAVQLVEP